MTQRDAANTSELVSALAASVGGDEVVLTGQSYGHFDWGGTYSSPVTLRGSDPDNRPLVQFSGDQIAMGNLNGAIIQGIDFQRLYVSGNSSQVNTIVLSGANEILMENCGVKGGTMPNGAFNGRGIAAQDDTASDVTFRNVKFEELFKGIVASAANLTIDTCEFTKMRSDGMTLSRLRVALIQRCWLHAFNTVPGSEAHPDMIQFTRSTGIGSHDVILRQCVLDAGAGLFGQGLFAGDSGQNLGSPGDNVRHRRFTVEDMAFYVDHTNLCNLSGVDDLTYRRISAFRSENEFPFASNESLIRANECTQVTLDNCVAGQFDVPSGSTEINNVVSERSDLGTHHTVIASTPETNSGFTDDYHDYEINSGGAVHTANAGARIMKREGGWGGLGIEPHPDYPGGFRGAGSGGGGNPPSSIPADGLATLNINVV